MFRYSYNKIFWGTLHFCENQQNRGGWLITFFKNAGEERVKFDMRYARWMHVSLKFTGWMSDFKQRSIRYFQVGGGKNQNFELSGS